ncbi:MAG: hypothetical protein COZ58_02030 [Candidatus Infernicultor aquiphilus]|uniref:Peptidase C-terminal archaeal/bacterial domain-containing protein n=2 Tax=Candidatus Infernicultor aquiphilus TaxID=1805029 RepID=A0A2M7K9X4_9BACT|nr:MAG: hypothetical protein COZ58_02030 [Candidatus Atribacteria bacterium CG_4_8_14_3_um_filter_34_18]
MKIRKVLTFLIVFSILAMMSLSAFAVSSSNLANKFQSNGDLIQSWYWLRDNNIQDYAQWTFENIPSGNNDLILEITALATNRSGGGRGFPADFLLIYEVPGGNVFITQKVSLPNVSSANDPVGYTCSGQVIIPRSDLQGASVLFLRTERISPHTNHLAFNKDSIKIIETTAEENYPPYQGNQLPDTNNQNEAFLIQPGIYNGSLGGQISGGQRDNEDWYSINLQAGQIINLQLIQPSTGSFNIYLRPPELTSNVGSATIQDNTKTLQYVANITGIWYIKIIRSSGEGEYQLSINIQNQNDAGSNRDAGDTPEEAIALYPGIFTGFLQRADNVDWYSINLQERQTINLQLSMLSDASFGLSLTRPGSTSGVGSVQIQDKIKTLQYVANVSGIWQIKITRSSGEGEYQLSVNLSDYPSDQTGQSQSGSSPIFTANKFYSNGNLIQGWYWLRDSALKQYAEWTFENVPPGTENLLLNITALATNQADGGRGFPAKFKLIYGFPGSGSMGGVFQTMEVTLPNTSPRSDPVGYTCQGLIMIPRSFIAGASTFFFRVERISSNDNHVAFNKQSITLSTGEQTSGFYQIESPTTK